VHKTIDWSVVSWLAAGNTPSTALTLLLLSHFDINGSAAYPLITVALSVALGVTAAALIFRNRILAFYAARVGEIGSKMDNCFDNSGRRCARGARIDFLGRCWCPWSDRPHPALPSTVNGPYSWSDIAHAVPLTLIAVLGHWVLGTIDWPLLCSLLAGSLPGIVFGSCTAVRVPESVLRFGLATMLIIVASRLVV
jgi:uncharacterized protein